MTDNIEQLYRKKHKNKLLKNIVYFIQALFGFPLIVLLRLLPIDASSWLGGKTARFVGYFLPEHKIALMNLKLAFPDKSPQELKKIALNEWENIGRVIGEYPHISRKEFLLNRMEITGNENALEILQKNKGGIFISIHMGNWELCPLVASNLGVTLNTVYRNPNNPFFEKIFRFRTKENLGEVIPKGEHSGARLLQIINNKGFIGMLIDQKLREGLELDFFGKPAMTTHFPGLLSYRYECPVIMVKIERTKGVHFKVKLYPPLYADKSKKSEDSIKEFSQKLNDIVEGWIKENPSQWLWIHKRWKPEAFLAKKK